VDSNHPTVCNWNQETTFAAPPQVLVPGYKRTSTAEQLPDLTAVQGRQESLRSAFNILIPLLRWYFAPFAGTSEKVKVFKKVWMGTSSRFISVAASMAPILK
jgi:hypothetical protein